MMTTSRVIHIIDKWSVERKSRIRIKKRAIYCTHENGEGEGGCDEKNP